MADRVWKFQLLEPTNQVEMPPRAEVLHVGEQYGRIALWARVNPDTVERVTRTFHVVGTGHPMPDGQVEFRGTAVTSGGALVFHVFEAAPEGMTLERSA